MWYHVASNKHSNYDIQPSLYNRTINYTASALFISHDVQTFLSWRSKWNLVLVFQSAFEIYRFPSGLLQISDILLSLEIKILGLNFYILYEEFLNIYIYIYIYMYTYIFIYIHRHVFRPSQDSSVWLGLTNREQLISADC